MPMLKAMPGRVVLLFQKPVEQNQGGIIIPKTSARRPEFGKLVSIGAPLNDNERILAREIIERDAAGEVFPVSYGAGVSFFQAGDDSTVIDPSLAWLADVRAYRITELSVSLPPEE